MIPPTHICPSCGCDKFEIDLKDNIRKVTCTQCGKTATTYNNSLGDQEAFLALNQRISTLQDVLLNQQESISKLVDGLEYYTKITRALVNQLETKHPLEAKK